MPGIPYSVSQPRVVAGSRGERPGPCRKPTAGFLTELLGTVQTRHAALNGLQTSHG
ncbi:hypothetical protein BMS3Bbin01_00188 [bacterium BMS3Bbin01]|nr:hypothetical protein BMS3Bbin01_00188 [bacterium BMS3Bbin01]